MFKKWNAEGEGNNNGGNGVQSATIEKKTEGAKQAKDTPKPPVSSSAALPKRSNTILKGSKLTGDIHVTSDLELSGDVEGNIKSDQDCNIILKGNCKGNIETKGGSVSIDGSLEGGNIIAGKDVTISGKFSGGEVTAKNKVYVDGAFSGKLTANEVEIGSNANGKGEIHYKEYISISRGARIEAQISQGQPDLKVVKDVPQNIQQNVKQNVQQNVQQKKVVDMRPEKAAEKEAK